MSEFSTKIKISEKMADIITDTNDNNGVEKALKDLIGD